MPELELNDVTLRYEMEGNGPPLLLIAGFMSDSASWAPLRPLLADHFTLIIPDNRTTGRTQPWNAPTSTDIWAADAFALMDHLGHRKAHVLGHSLGGNIGWVMSHRAPERIASYTMAASAPLALERNFSLFRALIAIRKSNAPEDTWLKSLYPWLFAPAFYNIPGAVEAALQQSLSYPHAQTADAMEHQLNSMLASDPEPFQSAPKVPMQAILAEKDLLVPLDLAQSVLGHIPQQVIPKVGHSIHWDAPEAVAQHLRSFTDAHSIE